MHPFRIDRLSPEQHAALDRVNRKARDGRLPIRALTVLRAAKRGMVTATVAVATPARRVRRIPARPS